MKRSRLKQFPKIWELLFLLELKSVSLLKKKYLSPSYTYYLLLSLLLICGFATAQNSDNPFDIVPRVQKVETIATATATTTTTPTPVPSIQSPEDSTVAVVDTNIIEASPEVKGIEIDPNNPFELVIPNRAVPSTETVAVSDSESTVVNNQKTVTDPRLKASDTQRNRGALFGTILGLSLILAFLFAAFRSSFNKAYQNVTSANILKQSYREMSTIGQTPLNLWYIFSWFSIGVFVFLVMRHYGATFTDSFLTNLFYCIGLVCALMLLKHFVLFFIGNVFPVRKEVQLYNFLVVIFGVAIGVLLVPFNIFIAYLPEKFTLYAIYGSSVVLVIFYLFRAFRALILSNRFLSFHRFHFLLYLCAVEIAPIIILLKLGLIYAGK